MPKCFVAVVLLVLPLTSFASTAESRLSAAEKANEAARERVCQALEQVKATSSMSSSEAIRLREALLDGRAVSNTALARAYDRALEALEAPEMKYASQDLKFLAEVASCKEETEAYVPGETLLVKEASEFFHLTRTSEVLDVILPNEKLVFLEEESDLIKVYRAVPKLTGFIRKLDAKRP